MKSTSGEALLTVEEAWRYMLRHESYQRGLVDIADVIEELKHCERHGVGSLIAEADVRRAIEQSATREGEDEDEDEGTLDSASSGMASPHATHVLKAGFNMTVTGNAGNGTALLSIASPGADSPWSETDGPPPPYALSPGVFYHSSIDARIGALDNL